MKLVTFALKQQPDVPYIGVWEANRVIKLDPQPADMLSLIASGVPDAAIAGEAIPADSVVLKAPLAPGKIICVGRNYAAHAKELGNDLPDAPLLFAKFSSSVIGHGETITWRAAISAKVDWEGELVVIIGKPARYVSENRAMAYIFGYTIANDVTARDLQGEETIWLRSKGIDTFCPLGPHIVTADEIPDPHALTLQTKVNGETMQNASTRLMMFKIPYLISYCSQAFTLHPGDMILTGTPAGVGKGMTPPRFLRDGDEVTISISGIGDLTNTCRVEEAHLR